MATATMERTRQEPVVIPEGDDGYPVMHRTVDGERVAFSTKPFAEAARPLYWNPIYPGQEMWWRAEEPNAHGFRPVIQKEAWTDGCFRPRNPYEEHMTREWMVNALPGCSDADLWKGENHPDGPGHVWRCECSWPCGNHKAFQAHRRHLKHQEMMSD